MKKYVFEYLILLCVLVVAADISLAHADISNPHPLPPTNTVTNGMLTATAVQDNVVAPTAGIAISKITGTNGAGTIPFQSGGGLSSDPALHYQTSGRRLFITNGSIEASSTNFGGVSDTWPSADGTAGQFLSTNGAGVLSYANAGTQITATNINGGEIIGKNNPVYAVKGTSTLAAICNTNDGTFNVGATLPQQEAQSFMIPGGPATIGLVDFFIQKAGTPLDGVGVQIRQDNAGLPTGAVVASTTIDHSQIALTPTEIMATTTFVSASASTTYWIVLYRTGALDDSNLYQVNETGSGACYANGELYKYTGTWNDAPGDLRSNVFGVPGEELLYRAINTSSSTSAILGFAQATTSAGVAPSVVISGTISGFSGLSAGTNYYVGSASGTISSTLITRSNLIGRAFSSSTLEVIINNP